VIAFIALGCLNEWTTFKIMRTSAATDLSVYARKKKISWKVTGLLLRDSSNVFFQDHNKSVREGEKMMKKQACQPASSIVLYMMPQTRQVDA
jgi:hypothetical protein